jgi:HPt (histidine-containing phosphotransfer) domain-containing protein
MDIYWIEGHAQDCAPKTGNLTQQGATLHMVDSVAHLATSLAAGVSQAVLVIAGMETATSGAMQTLGTSRQGGMNSLGLVVLADDATEATICTCIRSGAIDMVPLRYACDYLNDLLKKHINPQGTLRVDPDNIVAAIDGHAAMARIASDRDFFGSLLRTFFDELPERRQRLHDDWSKDTTQVKHSSHSLKGLALTLGLGSMGKVAAQAETLASEPGATLDAALLLQLEGEILSARLQILRWLFAYSDYAGVTP